MIAGSERAARLWADLGVDDLKGAERALAEEACEITGRLEELNAAIAGSSDVWLQVKAKLGMPEVFISAPMAEARQQATALRGVLSELRAHQAGEKVAPAPPASVSDELKRRREARRAGQGA